MLDAETRIRLNNMIKWFIRDGSMEDQLKFAQQLLQLADHPDKMAIQALLENNQDKYALGDPEWIDMLYFLHQMAKAINED
jgi:hypothetical protein